MNRKHPGKVRQRNWRVLHAVKWTSGLAALIFGGASIAQTIPDSPFYDGPYMSVSAHAIDSRGLDSRGYGGMLGGGYRNGRYAVEVGAVYSGLSEGNYRGFAVNGLLFPFVSVPNLYATIGVGGLSVTGIPETQEFSITTFDGGLGYLWPLTMAGYEFGLRLEARYRHGIREKKVIETREDIQAPTDFNDTVASIGLYIPLRLGKASAPAAAAPPVVVPLHNVDGSAKERADQVGSCPKSSAASAVDTQACLAP